jgi:hypothetical protein
MEPVATSEPMVRKCAPLHLPDQRVVEEVFGLRVQWSVDCNHVANTDHRFDVRVVSESLVPS